MPIRREIPSIGWKAVKQESARKVMRISTQEAEPVVAVTESTCNEINEASLKKVLDLAALLTEKTGRTVNSRTWKQDIIAALLNSELRSE